MDATFAPMRKLPLWRHKPCGDSEVVVSERIDGGNYLVEVSSKEV